MIRALIALSLMSGSAQAGAWDEFKQRCLIPMEEVVSPVATGLQQIETQIDGALELEIFSSVSVDFEDLFIVGRDSSLDQVSCGLVIQGADKVPDSIQTPLDLWSEGQFARGRYRNVTDVGHHTFKFVRSTTWREPKMEVEFYSLGRTLYLIARETDLES